MKKFFIFIALFIVIAYSVQADLLKAPSSAPDIQAISNTSKLVIINEQIPIEQQAWPADLVLLTDYTALFPNVQLANPSIQLSQQIVPHLTAMLEAAAQDGATNFIINSGYRSYEEQNALYEELGGDYALPAGYSEHHLGLALDIGSTDGLVDTTVEGAWLQQNASAYGFILRYPAHKVEITNIQYEPWHFRYVGLPHSLVLKEKDWVLEEYVHYLKEHKALNIEIAGVHYVITY